MYTYMYRTYMYSKDTEKCVVGKRTGININNKEPKTRQLQKQQQYKWATAVMRSTINDANDDDDDDDNVDSTTQKPLSDTEK